MLCRLQRKSSHPGKHRQFQGRKGKCIDWLLQRHARWEKFIQGDPLFRKRHNALVLEYIISHPMTHTAIEKRLGISDNGFKNQLEKGISELAQILFRYRE